MTKDLTCSNLNISGMTSLHHIARSTAIPCVSNASREARRAMRHRAPNASTAQRNATFSPDMWARVLDIANEMVELAANSNRQDDEKSEQQK
jgi:hypothetical protein